MLSAVVQLARLTVHTSHRFHTDWVDKNLKKTASVVFPNKFQRSKLKNSEFIFSLTQYIMNNFKSEFNCSFCSVTIYLICPKFLNP